MHHTLAHTILVIGTLAVLAAIMLGAAWYASFKHGVRWSEEQHAREEARAAARAAGKAGRA